MFSSIHPDCPAAESQVVGITNIDTSGPLLPKTGQTQRSPETPFKNLLHVHGRIRYQRRARSERAVGRNILRSRTSGCPSLKLRVPLKPVPFGLKRKEFYATTEVARVVGISPDLFRWRMRVGHYSSPKWKNKRERAFTLDEVCTLIAMHQER